MSTDKIIPGISFEQEITVTTKDTAIAHGSGKLEVFATPALIGLMENTALKCLEGLLAEHEETVGIEINAKHTKATAINKRVRCKATITGFTGRLIRFEIEAWDEVSSIGTAVHDRFIIDPEKFMQKLR